MLKKQGKALCAYDLIQRFDQVKVERTVQMRYGQQYLFGALGFQGAGSVIRLIIHPLCSAKDKLLCLFRYHPAVQCAGDS